MTIQRLSAIKLITRPSNMMHSLSISRRLRQHILYRRRHGFFTSYRSFSSISTFSQRDDSHHHDHNLQSSSSNSINTQEDWREIFRSSDYDDAWSAYQPFISPTSTTATSSHQQEEDTNNSINNIDITTHQNQIIPSIFNGSWKRRIFGMNLVPLSMTYDGVTVDEYIDAQRRSELEQRAVTNNTSTNQQQQQSSPQNEIETILNNPELTKQQSKLQRIDIQTRFLCRMLDDLYRTNIWREIDRPRTERCHRAIGRLMTMTPENPPRRPKNNKATTNQQQQKEGIGFTGLAQRAGAILHKLELCSPLALRNKQQVERQSEKLIESTTTTADDTTTEEDIEQTTSAEDNDTTSSYQGVYNSYPQHLSHTKFALPTPTQAIYNMVLLSYGKEEVGGSSSNNNNTGREGRETGRGVGREVGREVPQQAEDVIWGMLSRVVQQQQLSIVHNDNDNVEKNSSDSLLYPTVENWNCVLSCWSKSYDTDKAFYAFSFLLSWMEWNKHIELNDELFSSLKSSGSSVDGVDGISKPDMDSFYFVLQSCLVNDEFDILEDGDANSTEDESKGTRIQRAKEMGAGVAIRLWNEMQRCSNNTTSMDIDSTMYYEILQAICQSSELPSTKSTTSRPLAALARVFTSCCKDGMNTIEIMNLVRDHTTESQFDQLKVKVATYL